MQCDKTIYESQKHAINAIRGISAREHQSFTSYRCSECRGWHISTVKHKKLRPLKEWVMPEHLEKPFKFPKPNPIQGTSKQKSISTQGKIMTKEQTEILRAKFTL